MNNETASKPQDLTLTFSVDRSPEQVFEAINNVRGWWSKGVEGPTDTVGGAFTYQYADIHRSVQKVIELVPGKRVAWLVEEARLEFTENKGEWVGTRVVFDIAAKGKGTELHFTHVGLSASCECYSACMKGWGFYVGESLRKLIATGKGEPDPGVKVQTVAPAA
jgi:hypothetical protein